MTGNRVKVSILIPLYNGEQVIGPCLDSVLASGFKDYEILVLDDCSGDKSVSEAEKYLPRGITLVSNDKNAGFVKNIHRGIKKAKGKIIVLLNMDTIVEKDWLEELIKPFDVLQGIGAVGSKIYYMGDAVLQHAGAYLDDIARSYHTGRGELDNGQYNTCREVEYVCGASLAFQKDAIESVGGFDTGYSPAYYEEADMAFRLRKAGYKIIYAPASRLRHHECYATKGAFFYYISKNRLRFVFKHFSLRRLLFDFIPKERRFFVTNNNANRKDLLKAYLFTLFGLFEISFRRLKEKTQNVKGQH